MKYFTAFRNFFWIGTSLFLNSCESEKSQMSFAALNKTDKYREYEFQMLKSPESGMIPSNMRSLELSFAQTLPKHLTLEKTGVDLWQSIGPYHIGGRTRAFAQDVSNSNVLIAGGVNGGIWKSLNKGQSWNKISPSHDLQSVTCLKQDRRQGRQNVWYYGTGEGYGASASADGAFFLGNGIYKSTDGGQTFSVLPSTAQNSPQSFNSPFEIVWNIALSPNDSLDVIYAATYGNVYQSIDGGSSWAVLKGGNSYFTDVASTSTDITYFTMSSEGTQAGIWRMDGLSNAVNIIPTNFPLVYNRLVIGVDPNNENIIYFLGNTPGFGKFVPIFFGDTEYNSLWKYEYISGDGSGTGGIWTDLSQNLPQTAFEFDNFNTQGSYNVVVSVMPGNPDVVFIGGTNLYRSTDGFTTPSNTTQVGGYAPSTMLPFFNLYPNHHPDQHVVFFDSQDPNVMYSATDGGIFKTSHCLANNITWESLNNGYITTQIHTIGLDKSTSGSQKVAAGFQDYGSWFQNSINPLDLWTFTSTGDGAYLAFQNGGDIAYFSRQNGEIIKTQLNALGEVQAFTRIDPIGAENYLFINPFILDPTDQNVMYLAEGNKLWRNENLGLIPLDNQYQKISTHWFRFTDTLLANQKITCLAASSDNPYYRLYVGTNQKRLYRIDNANFADPNFTDISGPWSSNAYVSSIAVDPFNGDHLLVCLSNYLTYSIYASHDGGGSWQKCAGNLEQFPNGTGNGPSTRWLGIMPVDGQNTYWVGTSIGLFSTDKLQQDSTTWIQQSPDKIGNNVVPMLDVRALDGKIVVATHGNGAYSANITDLLDLTSTPSYLTKSKKFYIFPNPVKDYFYVESERSYEALELYDVQGKKMNIKYTPSSYYTRKVEFEGEISTGVYFVVLSDHQGNRYTQKIILQK